MSKSVYLLVIGEGYTEAWYQLSKQKQDELWSKVQAVDEQVGAKWVITCDSRWADEGVPNWAVIEYPDMEAYQKKVQEVEKLEWWRYWSAKTILGTEYQWPD
jgi:hypothetical protein